jgi:hypothetical protein
LKSWYDKADLLEQRFQFVGIGVARHQFQQLQQAGTGNRILLRQAAVGMQRIVTREPTETFSPAGVKLNGITDVLGQVRPRRRCSHCPVSGRWPTPASSAIDSQGNTLAPCAGKPSAMMAKPRL